MKEFGPAGDVLELAGGTGLWTERLARTARHLTVVDSAPEALARNRQRRLGAGLGERVEYIDRGGPLRMADEPPL